MTPLSPAAQTVLANLTPEHTARRADGDLHPDIHAAYRYVHSIAHTADAESLFGALAWHGWALREAFLAGCSHAIATKLESGQ